MSAGVPEVWVLSLWRIRVCPADALASKERWTYEMPATLISKFEPEIKEKGAL